MAKFGKMATHDAPAEPFDRDGRSGIKDSKSIGGGAWRLATSRHLKNARDEGVLLC
jgi:hypothetical protein